MNRLFRVLHRWKCRNAAQKLALDALCCLDDDRQSWAGLLLWNVDSYFRGVDAPENDFRDYANHALYPFENWGGAARLARKWYWTTVEALRSRDWTEAAYAAGVLARYTTFALSPGRTGPDDESLARRRPVEWCLSQQYDELMPDQAEARPVRIRDGDDWLEQSLTTGAEAAHRHRQDVLERFDLEAVSRNTAALDDELRSIFATQLSRSASTLGAIFARAIAESEATPPRYPIAIAGLLALPSLPLFWMTRRPSQRRERKAVLAMARELRASGRIENTLPEEDRAVRDAYQLEVFKKSPPSTPSLPAPTPVAETSRRTETPRHESLVPKASASTQDADGSLLRRAGEALKSLRPTAEPAATRERPLTESSPIAAAPSIGAQRAAKFEAARVSTIGELLAADAEALAASLHPHATATDIATWQDEARLCCDVGVLTPSESQLLVACGVTGPEDLAALSPVELWELVVPVAESPDGRRLLQGNPAPDIDTVTRWIDAAKRPRQAA
ncbi:MAG: DUF4332 domain-containing protein [Planctomycetaceae bacterium]